MEQMLHDKPRLLRLRAVLDRIPVGRSAWYAGIQAGIYPRPVQLSPRRVAWRENDIDALVLDIISHAWQPRAQVR